MLGTRNSATMQRWDYCHQKSEETKCGNHTEVPGIPLQSPDPDHIHLFITTSNSRHRDNQNSKLPRNENLVDPLTNSDRNNNSRIQRSGFTHGGMREGESSSFLKELVSYVVGADRVKDLPGIDHDTDDSQDNGWSWHFQKIRQIGCDIPDALLCCSSSSITRSTGSVTDEVLERKPVTDDLSSNPGSQIVMVNLNNSNKSEGEYHDHFTFKPSNEDGHDFPVPFVIITSYSLKEERIEI